MKQMNIGVIGCGDIARKAYLKFAPHFPILKIAALADLDISRAQELAKEHEGARAMTVDELLQDDSVDVVLNLTIPAAHAEVSMQALNHGKHVYCEKPFSTSVEDGRRVLELAKKKGLTVGNAPDTFLGTAHQTARKVIDEGGIGRPVAAQALMLSGGPESWHPNSPFYYQPGGGPMLDMGPYYLTDLVNLLGPMKRVTGLAGIQISDRTAGAGHHKGKKLDVQTPDHVTGSIEFTNGTIASITTSFAVRHRVDDKAHPIVIYGTEGTLEVPDPNGFDRSVILHKLGEGQEPQEVAPSHTHPNGRSLGLAEMCHAIQEGRPARASGEVAFAVVQAMLGFLESSETGRAVDIIAEHDRPAMMPVGLGDDGVITG